MKLPQEQNIKLENIFTDNIRYELIDRLKKDFKLTRLAALKLVQSAELIEFYLASKGNRKAIQGNVKKDDFIKSLLILSRIEKLSAFVKINSTRSFRRKVAFYQAQKQISDYDAVKSLVSGRFNNSNSRKKITDQEYKFIEAFMRERPMSGYKRVYTALKNEFGSVSVTPLAVKHQIKNVLAGF